MKEFFIDINAPAEQVFNYVSDFSRHPEWSTNSMEMRVADAPVGVGTTFETNVKAFGSETARGKVVRYEPPSLLAYECETSTSGNWLWTMRLEPVESGTRLWHKAERLSAPMWFKAIQAVMYPIIGKPMQLNGLRNIKSRIEGATMTSRPEA